MIRNSLINPQTLNMSSLITFANDLAKYFESTADKKQAVAHIIYEINSRKDGYCNSLTDEDKKFVLHLVEEFICGNLPFNLKPGEMVVRKRGDYDAFLEMKKYILKSLLAKSPDKN